MPATRRRKHGSEKQQKKKDQKPFSEEKQQAANLASNICDRVPELRRQLGCKRRLMQQCQVTLLILFVFILADFAGARNLFIGKCIRGCCFLEFTTSREQRNGASKASKFFGQALFLGFDSFEIFMGNGHGFVFSRGIPKMCVN